MAIVLSAGVHTLVALMAAERHGKVRPTPAECGRPDGDTPMDALDLLLGRASASRLTDPAPAPAELDIMFQAALRAPDHGRLRPWDFVVIAGEHRTGFGELLAASYARREPDAPPESLQRERDKALRAPLIVVVAARVHKGHKIPEAEQIASAAAAAQNLLLAAYAQGYGAIWRTGAPAYDPAIAQGLGLGPDASIVGFLYLGTRASDPMPTQRPATPDHVRIWQG